MPGTCQYCGNEFKNLGSHLRHCKKKPKDESKESEKINMDEKPSKETKKELPTGMRNAISIVVGDVSIGIETTDSTTEQAVDYGIAILQGIAEMRGGEPEPQPENQPEHLIEKPDLEGQKEYENLMGSLEKDRKILPPEPIEPPKKSPLKRLLGK